MEKYAVAYLRVSSEEQVSNFSLENQEEYCIKEAERQGYKLLKIFKEEGKSAKTMNRPELVKMLDFCQKKINRMSAVFVYRYDRLSRDSYQSSAIRHKLSENGIEVMSATKPSGTDPMGKFFQNFSFAMAQLENDQKSQRTLDGMRKRYDAGWFHGKAPVGYINFLDENNRRIITEDPEQFDLVKKSWEEMANKTHTFKSIAEYMNKIGIVIKIGKKRHPVTHKHAEKLFKNKFYMGILVSERLGERPGSHEPMISENLFYTVQAFLTGKGHKTIPHQRRNPDFPLRWLVKCEICGKPLTGATSRNHMGVKYPYYYCNAGGHFSPSIPKVKFEKWFLEFLDQITPKKEFVDLFAEIVKEKWQGTSDTYRLQQMVAFKKLKEFQDKRQKLIDGHLSGVYDDKVFKEQLDMINNDIEARKSVIADSKLDQLDIETLMTFLKAFITNLSQAWIKGTLEQKQILFSSIFPDPVTFGEHGFRTTKLAQFIEPFRGIETPKQLLRVGERTRTANLFLHREAL